MALDRVMSSSSADHISVLQAALAQLPASERGQALVRADTGACSKVLLGHLTDAGLEYSVGFPALETVKTAVEAIPPQAWRAARDADGLPPRGAQVAELTAWMPAPTKPTRSPARFGPQHWPEGMRVIARRERPHPGAQLRLTDHDGWRITCFATNTRGARLDSRCPGGPAPARARAEDRIRGLKDTGLRNLPFHGFAQNQIWLEIVALAADLLTWTQTLAWDEHEPAPPLGTQTASGTRQPIGCRRRVSGRCGAGAAAVADGGHRLLLGEPGASGVRLARTGPAPSAWRTWAASSASSRRSSGQACRPTRRRRPSAAPASRAARWGSPSTNASRANAARHRVTLRVLWAARLSSSPSSSDARASSGLPCATARVPRYTRETAASQGLSSRLRQVAHLGQVAQGVVVAADGHLHEAGACRRPALSRTARPGRGAAPGRPTPPVGRRRSRRRSPRPTP